MEVGQVVLELAGPVEVVGSGEPRRDVAVERRGHDARTAQLSTSAYWPRSVPTESPTMSTRKGAAAENFGNGAQPSASTTDLVTLLTGLRRDDRRRRRRSQEVPSILVVGPDET